MAIIDGIIFHHTYTDAQWDVPRLRRLHMGKNGWRDIAYNFVILHDNNRELLEHTGGIQSWGQLVKKGRPINNNRYLESHEVGAHALGFNSRYIGVAIVGNGDKPIPTWQRTAIIEATKIWTPRYKTPERGFKYLGHRDVNATHCPGNEIYKLVKELQSGVYF